MLAAVIDRLALAAPTRTALVSPLQNSFRALDYGDISARSLGLARNLTKEYGYEMGDLLVSDLPNTTENLILQIACSRIGVAYATVKDSKGLEALNQSYNVRGAVTTSLDSILTAPKLYHPPIIASDDINADMLQQFIEESTTYTASTDGMKVHGDTPWAFFNSTSPLRHSEIMNMGENSATHLEMSREDRVCVSITLCHAFGIGSACASSLTAGAAIVLPAVGGIRGCGNPSQRAEATLSVMASEKCTLLFADTHTLKALPPATPSQQQPQKQQQEEGRSDLSDLSSFRGGVVKVGSGSDFMDETVSYGDVTLLTMSKRPASEL